MSEIATPFTMTLADYRDPADAAALVALLDGYARDPMGGSAPLGDEVREHLAKRLSDHPGAFSLIARSGNEPVGLANCLTGFSTFAARPLVNLHDLYVEKAHRGRGIGAGLFAAIETEAKRRGACKVTLEVLSGNETAQALYTAFGYQTYALDPAQGSAQFWEKTL